MASDLRPDRGSFVSEWFGLRIYPEVRIDSASLQAAKDAQCPFLGQVLGRATRCVKSVNSAGVCSVSSPSNGPRQDWLVCPFRVIDTDIVSAACQRIFGLAERARPLAAPVLADPATRADFESAVRREGSGYLFFQNKLGGELGIAATASTPELSFDVTLVEVKATAHGHFEVARFGVLEIQTMDYHGSYARAVQNLRDALRLHPGDFAGALSANLEAWAGDGMEGPNVANVFKRTFYQMLVKFRLVGDPPAAAGSVLALPRAVWDSWQQFLGSPELLDEVDGVRRLASPGREGSDRTRLNSFILVFDLDASASSAVSPVRLVDWIRVSPESLTHHAFTQVPRSILQNITDDASLMVRIRSRLATWWPGFEGAARDSAPAGRPTQATAKRRAPRS